MLSTASGFNNLLKEGHKHFGGLEEAILKNIDACKEISNMTKTSFGPDSMKKMVINHIDKIFVTSDAATIMKELEVQHPAAKMVVMASKMQEDECGDNTNYVITLAGELLEQAESLIKMGLHPSEIVLGYEGATKKIEELLQKLVCYKITNVEDSQQVALALRSVLAPKIFSYHELFANLVADACVKALPYNNPAGFDPEFVRVAKILGGKVEDSQVLQGMVVVRNSEGTIQRVEKPKIAVFGCPLDTIQQDTKGTILIKNANDLLNYTKTEEDHAESVIKGIADSGVSLVIVGGSISDICLHFCEKYKIMVVRIPSKFELRRLCRALSASPLARLGPPTAEEMGECDSVHVEEIGSQKCIIFKRDTQDCRLATIILRGSTMNLLDDIERAIDDGVSVYKGIIRDQQFIPGAGATEIQLALQLEEEASKIKGLDQYSYGKYAKAFEVFPRILAENAGLKSNVILTTLYSQNTQEPAGIDVQQQVVVKSSELKVYDHYQTKLWAIKLASDAAITVLRVDQIIVSKPAGGPKPPKQTGGWDDQD